MNNPLNFRSGAAASLNQAQAAKGVSSVRPVAPTQATAPATATPAGTRPGLSPAAGAPVHMATEEMERHVSEALEDSPVFTDEQAPVIDPDDLDNQTVAQDDDVPEADSSEEGMEGIEFQEVEIEEEEDPYASSDEEGERGGAEANELEDYLSEELKAYQRDKAVPAKRQARLLKDRDGRNERPGAAALATACESDVGGLARTLPGMAGDFIGLAGAYRGQAFGVLALTNPAQLQGFLQELRKNASRSDISFCLLDLSRIPAAHQAQVLKNLPACGVKPRTALIWLGPGKKQWSS